MRTFEIGVRSALGADRSAVVRMIMGQGARLVLTGLVIWKPVQFHAIGQWLGDYEGARFLHFFAMAALVFFVLVHVFMVAIVPRTFPSMFSGRIRVKT